jgi:SOS response regulatory protein OraA/RecX
VLANLLQFLKIAGIDQSTIEQALNLDFEDFEDAVQMMAAVQCRVDYLVTRNTKDYTSPLLPVVQPIDFVTSTLS